MISWRILMQNNALPATLFTALYALIAHYTEKKEGYMNKVCIVK